MLRLLGGAVLALCAVCAGMSARRALYDRVRLLRALVDALGALEREVSFRLTPLPRLFEGLAARCPAPVNRFFSACAGGTQTLGETPLAAVWNDALSRELTLLTAEEGQILRSLGAVLGRYDAARQGAALQEAARRLDDCLAAAEERRQRLGRVYGTMGVAGGLFLLILVL